jgi:hypothetical protein
LFLEAARAFGGEESAAVQLIDAAIEDATARGEGRVLGLAGHVTAVPNKVFAKLGMNSLEGSLSPCGSWTGPCPRRGGWTKPRSTGRLR